MPAATGLLLAAGAGRRMGTPKALLRDDAGVSFLARSVDVLVQGGCVDVVVVLGAQAADAKALLTQSHPDPSLRVVVAEDWAEGMGASLRAGLAELAGAAPVTTCALVSLVDLPDVGPAVVRRVLARLGSRPDVLGRAWYDGVPGHPTLLGRDHWTGIVDTARGDRGARDYLAEHPPVLVECGDLATGIDVDTADDLRL